MHIIHVDDPNVTPELLGALAELSTQQRTMVLLVHAFGWSFRDVASMLDDVLKRPFITLGMVTFVILLALAVAAVAEPPLDRLDQVERARPVEVHLPVAGDDGCAHVGSGETGGR